MNEDAMALAKLRLEEMLTFFGINTTVKVEEDGERIMLLVDTPENSRLIGRRGETMQALQHLVNMMVRGKQPETVYVNIDIGDYRRARGERLEAKAKQYADKVASSGEDLHLKPMSAGDRRVMHMALSEHPEVMTESTGEGRERHLVIKKRGSEPR